MKHLAIIFATAAMVATPVVAQDNSNPETRNDNMQTGSRFKRRSEAADMTEARVMQKDVARCVVYRNKQLSRELLANSDTVSIDFYKLDDVDADGLFDELDVADCLGRAAKYGTLSIRMNIQFRTLRNLMAEEVYLMDQDDPLVLPANAPEYLENRNYATGRHPAAVATAKLSDCLTFNDVANSDALLRSRPGSDEEDEALEAIFPALETCAGEGIAEAEIETSMVRTVIADGMWARMHYGPTAPVAVAEEETKDDDA